MGKNKKNNTKTSYKTVKITVFILILIATLAIIFALYRSINLYQPSKIFSLPLIETEVYSSDGEIHDVKTNISFSIDNKLIKNYDEQEILNITTETISSLNYDELNEPYGTDYLKNSIYETIAEQKPDIVNENFNVYVSGYDLGLVNGYLPGLIHEDTFNDKLQQMFGN